MNHKYNIYQLKQQILSILKTYGVTRAGLFGSYATGRFNKKSDIDLLVEIKDDISLLDFLQLKLRLEKKIGKKVDLVEYNTIKPLLREKILKDEVSIL